MADMESLKKLSKSSMSAQWACARIEQLEGDLANARSELGWWRATSLDGRRRLDAIEAFATELDGLTLHALAEKIREIAAAEGPWHQDEQPPSSGR